MQRPRLHANPWLCCTAVAGAVFLLSGMRSGSGGLTPEQFEILQHMQLTKLPDGQGGLRLTVRFTGVNVQIVNGDGDTQTTDGTGNLIVGYDEPAIGALRTGSHNLVVGKNHSYTSHGGAVIGLENESLAPYAAVAGGRFNSATAFCAAVAGGNINRATGEYAAVGGGRSNTAAGAGSSVSGGYVNNAEGVESSILGGEANLTAGEWSTVAGGSTNSASGHSSAVSGGCFASNPTDCSVVP